MPQQNKHAKKQHKKPPIRRFMFVSVAVILGIALIGALLFDVIRSRTFVATFIE